MNAEELYKKIKENTFLLAGLCAIKSEELVMRIAEDVKKISETLNLTYIFKVSFDKANRTSLNSFRGLGLDEGLRILEKVKKEFNLPIVTDIHESHQAKPIAEVADILQIPAFLCRQTDLLVAAAKTDKIVNIKKAQFLDRKDMFFPTQKVREAGNSKIMLIERGTLLGLGRLVVDFIQIVDMKEFGYPVIMDVTHSTQRPRGGATSCGNPHYTPYIAKVAAVGVDGYFMEVHPNPKEALSDDSNILDLENFNLIINDLKLEEKRC